jgi:hypothetical protein
MLKGCYNKDMRYHDYFKKVISRDYGPDNFYIDTQSILKRLSDAFSQLDEGFLIDVARASRKASNKALRLGESISSDFLGTLADYSHLLYSLSVELYGSDEEYENSETSADPADIHQVLNSFYQDMLSNIIAEEYQISSEEAKVFISLSNKYNIDFDFYF